MRRCVPLLLLAALAQPARADVDPSDAAVVLPIRVADAAAEDVHVDLPPSLFAHLRDGTEDLVVVDADGASVALTLRTRDGDEPGARADLEPRLVSRRASASGLALTFDLRVRAAPGLQLELELRGPVDAPLHVADSATPLSGPWEEVPFLVDESAEDRVVGRAVVPSGAGQRYVRVVVPTDRPSEVRVARAAATITRHRIRFRTAHGRAPFTLLAGFAETPLPAGSHASDPIAGWDDGAPGTVSVPEWLPPAPGLGAPSGGEPAGGGRPFPGAEFVATLLLVALTIWAVLLRKER